MSNITQDADGIIYITVDKNNERINYVRNNILTPEKIEEMIKNGQKQNLINMVPESCQQAVMEKLKTI